MDKLLKKEILKKYDKKEKERDILKDLLEAAMGITDGYSLVKGYKFEYYKEESKNGKNS